jgi:MbtH protein
LRRESILSPNYKEEAKMYRDEKEDTTIYKVVVNHEEQYSIWPADRENPLGWKDVGKTGLKDECLAYIGEVWTDMRPLSLRKRMEEMEKSEGDS